VNIKYIFFLITRKTIQEKIIKGGKKMLKIFLSLIISVSLFTGCGKTKSTNINFTELQASLISKAAFENSQTENLKDITTAQKYGLAIDDIEEGFAYLTNNENSDRIILAKTKGSSSSENVEKSLANEVSGLIATWEDNTSESKKLQEHVLKTKENYVILIISENSAELEDEFDNYFSV